MSVSLCPVCFRCERAPGSRRCFNCAPGVVGPPPPPRPRPPTRFERAAADVGDDDHEP